MKKVILTILDGFGIRDEEAGNSVRIADTKAIDKLLKEFPNSRLKASGEAVGLPEGQMGNSEIGHITIGSGRIIDQPLQKINKALEDGSFYKNEEILRTIRHAKINNTKLHILGLISDGGVHSHINHIFALIKMAKDEGIEKLYIHAFLDGRDVGYSTSETYLNKLEEYLKEIGIGKIATISGRFYSMDREKAWERTKKSYDALLGIKGLTISSYKSYIEESYRRNIYDEFVVPAILDKEGKIEKTIQPKIKFNNGK